MVFSRRTHGNPISAEVVIGMGVLLFTWYQINKIQCETLKIT